MNKVSRWKLLFITSDYQTDIDKENLVGLTYYPIGYSRAVVFPFQGEVLTMGKLPIFFAEPQVSLFLDRMIYHDFNFNTQLIVDIKTGEKPDDWQLHELQCGREIGDLLSPKSVMMWDVTVEFSYMITKPSVYVFVNEKKSRAVVFEVKKRHVENHCPRCGYGSMTAFSFHRYTHGSLKTDKSFGYRCLNCGYEKH